MWGHQTAGSLGGRETSPGPGDCGLKRDYFAADGGVELDMPDRRDLPTDLRRRFRIAELYFSGDWGLELESFKADQERDRYQEAES